MKRSLVFLCFLFFSGVSAMAQTLSGTFPALANQTITLEGAKGFDTYSIGSTRADEKGQFTLSYVSDDYGIAFLSGEDKQPFVVILEKEGVRLEGQVLGEASSIRILAGQENRWFEQYTQEQGKREQASSAWTYLKNLYQNDPYFVRQQVPNQAIQTELLRIQREDQAFIGSLPTDSFVRWFLPIRKLVSSVGAVAQYRTEELPETVKAFRSLDYADPRLAKSGLFRDVFESHFWLLENSGGSLDAVYGEMSLSIDAILGSLVGQEEWYNEVVAYLFELFEKHSLVKASEYLALKALQEEAVALKPRLANQLESYRSMKVGTVVPEIIFTGDVLLQGRPNPYPSKLSELTAPYRLVIFGASWCPACSEQMAKLIPLYQKWAAQGVEVLFVSLDTDPKAFQAYSAGMPFIAYSDYKSWDTQAAKDYYVSGSPSFFLLDRDNKLVLRPTSTEQMDAWVDWKIGG
jgi:thiol-disulfide isomerase/thioredoxin